MLGSWATLQNALALVWDSVANWRMKIRGKLQVGAAKDETIRGRTLWVMWPARTCTCGVWMLWGEGLDSELHMKGV